MPKYLTETKVRKLANKRVGETPILVFARDHGINANSLSNYLSGYLPRCPPGLQQALGLRRFTVYADLDHPED
jgi:hypothetical protein